MLTSLHSLIHKIFHTFKNSLYVSGLHRKQGFLTSAVKAWLSGVMKPRRPSLSTTAKPSSVTQYSMQRMNAPSKSSEGPPVQLQVAVEQPAIVLSLSVTTSPLFWLFWPRADWRSREKGIVVRQMALRPLLPVPSQCNMWRYPSAVHTSRSSWRLCRLGRRRSCDKENGKETLHQQQQKQKTNGNTVGQQWDESWRSWSGGQLGWHHGPASAKELARVGEKTVIAFSEAWRTKTVKIKLK